MNAIEIIKQGLQQANWDDVSTGYKMLTGEDVVTPINNSSNRSLLSELERVISQFKTTDDTPQDVLVDNTPKKSKKARETKLTKPKSSQIRSDDDVQFITDIDVSSSEAAVNDIVRKAMAKQPKKNRQVRDPYVEETFECSQCGKECSIKDRASVSIDGSGESRCLKCVRNLRK